MNTAITKLGLTCVLMLISTIFLIAATAYVVRRGARRVAMAGVVSLWVMIYACLLIVSGLIRNELNSWLIVPVAGVIFFVVALLWTYITPALRGTTWTEMAESSKSRLKTIKDGDRSQGNEH